MEKGADLKGARLEQELILTEPMVSSLLRGQTEQDTSKIF